MISKLVIIISICALLFYQFIIVKKWYRPADSYLLWSCVLIIGALIVYPKYNWNSVGIIWWLISCFLCSLFSNLGYRNPIKSSNGSFNLYNGTRVKYKHVIIIFFIFAVAYSYRLLYLHGFSLFSIRSLSDLYNINNYFQGYRYGNMDESEDYLQQIFLCFTYALPLSGGILFSYNKNKVSLKKNLCFFTLLPNFLISFLNNTKTGIIFSVILFCSGFIIGNLLFYGENLKLSIKFIKKVLLLLIIFLILVFLIIQLRYNSNIERQETLYVFSLLKDYIFGCVVNFDHFFYDFLTFDQTISYSYVENSNILTANAFFIKEYGYVLTIFIWSGIGFISGCAYRNLELGRKGLFNVLILVFSYMNCIYFFTYIPYRYLTLFIGTFVLFPIFFFVIKKETSNFSCYKFDFKKR